MRLRLLSPAVRLYMVPCMVVRGKKLVVIIIDLRVLPGICMPVLPHGANPDTEGRTARYTGCSVPQSRVAQAFLSVSPSGYISPPIALTRAGVNAAHATDTEAGAR